MAHRRDHYEHAFENYLRCKALPYVAVDEARRKAFAGAMLKNFDFLVYSPSAANLLIDVKGRKFPDPDLHGRRRVGRPWENWVTRDDIEGLRQWEGIFGADFRAVLVFAYWLQGAPERSPFDDVHFHRGRAYAFAAIGLRDYETAARPRSRKWRTLTMPAEAFRRDIRDVEALL